MTVESSSFNRFRGDTYRLSFVIRNVSDLELAKPALELTLTDSQDQAVYRRVLLPAELVGRIADADIIDDDIGGQGFADGRATRANSRDQSGDCGGE